MAMLERKREEEEQEDEQEEEQEELELEVVVEKEKSIDDLEKEAMQIVNKISMQSEQMKEKISLKSVDPAVLRILKKQIEANLRKEFEKKRKEFEKKLKMRYQLKLEQELEKAKDKKKDKAQKDLIKKLNETHKWAFKEKVYPWMYFYKTKEEKTKFIQEWSDYILDYTHAYVIHTFDFLTESTKAPFKFLREREKYLREILEELASTEYAEWQNDEKTRLRIYWKSLEEWSIKLFEYCYWNGLEILTLIDLKEAGEEVDRGFSTLPPRDVVRILEILIDQKKAKWIDKKEKKTVKLKFDKL